MIRKKLKKHMKTLISNSTLDAAPFICNTTDTFCRRMWFMVIFFSSIGCAALCSKGFIDYMSYAVLTNVDFDVPVGGSGILSDIDIPNLVFCNRKTIKNSLFHYNMEARQISQLLGHNDVPKNQHFSQWSQEFTKHCPKPEQNEDRSTTIDVQALMGGINAYQVTVDTAAKIYTSRRDLLSKCFWQGVSFPCNTPDDPVMFSDIFTDDGLCFTFAYDSAYVRNMSEKIQLAKSRGLSKVKTADLTILLDLKQYQRCGHAQPINGEGFYIATGDRRRLAVTNMLTNTFRVHPGHEYKVVVKPVVTLRRTENLKRCTSKKYISADGKSPPLEYTKEVCEAASLIRMLINNCHCIPPVPENLNAYVNEQNLGLEIESYKPCISSFGLYSCLIASLMNAVTTTLGTEDANCKYACMELKYVNIMRSMNRLTETRIKNFNITSPSGWRNENETIDRWARKNLIILHFDFERQKYQQFVEIQRFTSSDLLLYIASACGLFFGMSVVSFFEIIYVIVYLFIENILE